MQNTDNLLEHSHRLVFIAGAHRSGTSILHESLRLHPDISGFQKTGVIEDEGQFLQNVYPTAKQFGGPGLFAFDPRSRMDEHHELATSGNAKLILRQWAKYWDLRKKKWIEKSPPNIVRLRFLQKLFPEATFVLLLRHPIAVSLATQKWCPGRSIIALLEHSMRCMEIAMDDIEGMNNVAVIRYEDFCSRPGASLDFICDRMKLSSFYPGTFSQLTDANVRYFDAWTQDFNCLGRYSSTLRNAFEGILSERMEAFGYRPFAPFVDSRFNYGI